MRDYEVTIILQPQLEEAERKQVTEKLEDLLVPGEKENVLTANHWGMRQLAYPILKFTEGYYILYEVTLDPNRIREIERSLEFNEDVIRYLVIRKEE